MRIMLFVDEKLINKNSIQSLIEKYGEPEFVDLETGQIAWETDRGKELVFEIMGSSKSKDSITIMTINEDESHFVEV